ncbi:unannotated protein [freshwater metagenome]|uniref:Unannotated protein n=1 Tax=freshwater metagenome TaxID=449393 RepID=A0A6J6D2E6_9ZZZZ
MSIETMKSNSENAAFSRSLFGQERTGLPPLVRSPRTWPGPGVSISSASAATGSSPRTSGCDDTLETQRPVENPRPPGVRPVVGGPNAGSGNIAPPTESRLPVMMFRTSTSQEASVPYSVVCVPIRPYTAAVGALASSQAIRFVSAAEILVWAATESAVKGASSSRVSLRPSSISLSRPGSTRPATLISVTSAANQRASEPGRIGRYSSEASAVLVRRGSTVTTLPPRARMA